MFLCTFETKRERVFTGFSSERQFNGHPCDRSGNSDASVESSRIVSFTWCLISSRMGARGEHCDRERQDLFLSLPLSLFACSEYRHATAARRQDLQTDSASRDDDVSRPRWSRGRPPFRPRAATGSVHDDRRNHACAEHAARRGLRTSCTASHLFRPRALRTLRRRRLAAGSHSPTIVYPRTARRRCPPCAATWFYWPNNAYDKHPYFHPSLPPALPAT